MKEYQYKIEIYFISTIEKKDDFNKSFLRATKKHLKKFLIKGPYLIPRKENE